jgi:hypothetical protein
MKRTNAAQNVMTIQHGVERPHPDSAASLIVLTVEFFTLSRSCRANVVTLKQASKDQPDFLLPSLVLLFQIQIMFFIHVLCSCFPVQCH